MEFLFNALKLLYSLLLWVLDGIRKLSFVWIITVGYFICLGIPLTILFAYQYKDEYNHIKKVNDLKTSLPVIIRAFGEIHSKRVNLMQQRFGTENSIYTESAELEMIRNEIRWIKEASKSNPDKKNDLHAREKDLDKMLASQKSLQFKLGKIDTDIDNIRTKIYSQYNLKDKEQEWIVELEASMPFLERMSLLGPWKFLDLLVLPNQLLTLILTLSMGLLGSVIHMTREYFFSQALRRSNWYFLFRPFLGMFMALTVYVFFMAGQFTIAGSQDLSQDKGNLNAFIISFLAIISGLLSEEAYTRIYKAGVAFFGETPATENAGKGTSTAGKEDGHRNSGGMGGDVF